MGEELYMFAGAPKAGPMLGDLWALHTGKHAWAERDADGKTPHVRCSQAVAAAGSDIFLLGGSYYKYAALPHLWTSFAALYISGPINSQALAPANYSRVYGRMTGTCS